MTLLLVTPDYRILIDARNQPVWLPFAAVEWERYQEALLYAPLNDAPENGDPLAPTTASFPHVAVRATDTEIASWAKHPGLRWESLRGYLDSPHVAQTVAQLKFREDYRFHPTTGEPLQHPCAAPQSGAATVFPRIDPAVIGLVELAGKSQILLGRNRLRPSYFSLIAGYVGLGENLEEAWAREVREETGRNVDEIRYWGSQPWPSSGSLMVAFRGTTADEEPTSATDDELAEIVWATRSDLEQLPLPAPGSIARKLIDAWKAEQKR